MKKIWFDEAWDGYLYWQTHDKKILKRLNRLVYRIRDGKIEIISCKGHNGDK